MQYPHGRVQAAGDLPSIPQLQEILSICCAGIPSNSTPPGRVAPLLPAAVPGSPSLCSPESESIVWAAARASTTARLRDAPGSVDAAHTVWAAKSLEPGRCRVGSVWPDTRARGRLRRGQACSSGPPAARQCLHARVESGCGGGGERGVLVAGRV